MWAHDTDSCDVVGADLPVTAVGIPVAHRWPRVSKREAITSPLKAHQTHTSTDAPSFLASTTLNGVLPRAAPPLPAEGHLLHEARHRLVTRDPRHRGRVDWTAVSIDTPEWVAASLREHQVPQPPLCRGVARYRVGAANRVAMSPLTEVDPYGVRPPRALPKPFAGPGYIPVPEERARVEAHYAATGRERLGKTCAGELGSPGGAGGGWLDRPRERTTAPPVHRFGATSAAAIGDARAGAALADTLRSEEEAGVPLALPSGAVFRAEPPYSDYFTQRREASGLPSLRDTALHASYGGLGPAEHRAGRSCELGGSGTFALGHSQLGQAGAAAAGPSGPSGHALFRALTAAHGERAGQHLSLARTIAAETGGGGREGNFKSGPLHWYNAVR